jgi:ligand-binding sensor domain-containing protein
MIFQNTTRGAEVWVATKDGGITVIRPSSWTRYTEATTDLPENEVSGLAYSTDTGLFWVGLATTCLASVDVDNALWRHYTDVNGYSSNLVTAVAARQMTFGEVWLASQSGLSLLRNGKVTNYILGSGIPAERVRHVLTDKDGAVWASFIGAGVGRVVSYETP